MQSFIFLFAFRRRLFVETPSIFSPVSGPGGSAFSSSPPAREDGLSLRTPPRELGGTGRRVMKEEKTDAFSLSLSLDAIVFSTSTSTSTSTSKKTKTDHHQALARRGRDLGPAGAAATLRKICFFFVLEGVKEGDRERKESIRKTSPSFFSPLVSSTFLLARKKTSVHRPSPGIPPLRRRPRSGRLQERAFAPGIA